MAADLDTLITSEIPDGRQNLLDSFTNLEKVAEYCENNYFQCENKRAGLEETKGYTTQSLASVAYQINTLAYNFLQMMDLQSSQLGEMESQVNHIVQTVGIHKEKVARREIGILTTNKSIARQYKIIAPANPERPIKYVRKPIDYSVLDDIGHGVRVAPPQQFSHHHVHYNQQPGGMSSTGQLVNQQVTPRQKRPSTSGSNSGQYGPGMVGSSQYAPGMGNASYGSLGNVSAGAGAGPAPTTKPPTPPQAVRYSSGTLTRNSKDYRTPPIVAPPQVPSNYAPNYPRADHPGTGASGTLTRQLSSSSGTAKQYGNLPSSQAQVQMVHPQMQPPGINSSHHYQPQDQTIDHLRGGGGGATMPRLSSGSLRSTGSHTSDGNPIYSRQLSAASIASEAASAANAAIYARQQQQLQQQQQHQQQQQMAALMRQSSQSSNSSGTNSKSVAFAPNASIVPSSNVNVPSGIPKKFIERVAAIYDYSADKDDELSFAEGDIIYVLKKNDDGWWEGVMNGVTGLFPGNYVEASL